MAILANEYEKGILFRIFFQKFSKEIFKERSLKLFLRELRAIVPEGSASEEFENLRKKQKIENLENF